MKSFAVIALIANVSAIRLGDAPDPMTSAAAFSYNERAPAAAGFVQTACDASGVPGVSCVPNSQLFATGMNGDEDLGQDITMKGEKFHYRQNMAQFATGMNGDEDLGQDITMKGEKFHYGQQLA